MEDSTHPVIGVGKVHGRDAQEVNECGIVTASAQCAQAGNQSIYWTSAVGISDPVVIDTEATGAWCTDLFGGREDHTLYRRCSLCPEGSIGENRDVHIDVGHRALLQLAEKLLCKFCRANESEFLCSPAGKYDGPAGSPGA